uniref:Diphthamide biosynthesis 5 n=2 Tax=Sinocyclocheilus grahami TaxID=75366 RepID=A0A672JXZ6_SINGR
MPSSTIKCTCKHALLKINIPFYRNIFGAIWITSTCKQRNTVVRKILISSHFSVVGACFGVVYAKKTTAAFLLFRATTHTLVLRALNAGIQYRVIHNASIMNAVGCCGLQLYNFGETVFIVFWMDTWRPESFYDKIKKNRDMGLHTLCLLDIKVKEQSMENLMRGRKIYEPPRYMTVTQAAEQLLEILQNRRDRGEELAMTEDTVCVGLARVGAEDQTIRSGTLQELASSDLGGPLHLMIISGHLHPLEVDMLKLFSGSEGLKTLKMTDSSTYVS